MARALALLDEVAASDAGLGVNELARRIGVNASTASRLLGTLEDGGLVERSPDGPYRLGLKLVALSDRVLGQLDVRERARPWLTWLVQETGETATLSVPGGGRGDHRRLRPVVVERGQHGSRRAAERRARHRGRQGHAGVRLDRPSSASELTAFTERTITDRARWRPSSRPSGRAGSPRRSASASPT